jgi:hypothetical protein
MVHKPYQAMNIKISLFPVENRYTYFSSNSFSVYAINLVVQPQVSTWTMDYFIYFIYFIYFQGIWCRRIIGHGPDMRIRSRQFDGESYRPKQPTSPEAAEIGIQIQASLVSIPVQKNLAAVRRAFLFMLRLVCSHL